VICENMKFCEQCDNILIPRKKKLYCQACDQEFNLPQDEQEEYVIVKHLRHEDNEALPIIIKKGIKSTKISPQDRKAHEEFFGKSEGSSGW